MTVTEAPPADAPEAPVKKTRKSGADRRPRGWLETDVKSITDKFVTGEVKLDEGEMLTPHRVARMVKDLESLDEAPSTGAVAAVFKRWEEIGFANMNTKPYAFLDYTTAGINDGLAALKETRSTARKSARKAAKEAEKAAASA